MVAESSAVIAGAGRGGNAGGDLALHHEHGALDGAGEAEEMQQNLRGNEVGQVADDEQLVAAGVAQGSEVGGENVLGENFDGGAIGELLAQARRQLAVEFDGNEVLGTLG